MKEVKEYLDMGFEIIATGMEMIEAVIDAHKELHGSDEDAPKSEHPGTFAGSLQDKDGCSHDK